jgi:hypothetical protein
MNEIPLSLSNLEVQEGKRSCFAATYNSLIGLNELRMPKYAPIFSG